MHTVRIIAGDLKGRIIPFNQKKFHNAEITPQKIKGAFFSTVGETLAGKSFCDLFGGSGQMGFEALSRGASPVMINEKDKARFDFIVNFTHSLPESSRPVLLNRPALSAMRYCASLSIQFDIIFMDPPYVKKKGETGDYNGLLESVGESGVLKKNGIAAVQHFAAALLGERVGVLKRTDHRVYGSSALSYFSLE
ncbi:MAG TPA: RsmD family RNA methyltransferase [Spirochaetota bacterium]|nr:RsmD family RNA methyltransferase [Spirochaetota bacterium]HPI90601.1 RsmD family RNA methyltransferase [Spirochaetota bacterium]HPR47721.1 RsmD family RNA methyltransferase [Spirochaetota bacterium]